MDNHVDFVFVGFLAPPKSLPSFWIPNWCFFSDLWSHYIALKFGFGRKFWEFMQAQD